VSQAGETMNDIMASVSRVTHIVSDIAAASQKQTSGIDQIGQAIGQIDRVTQRNAVLVEEAGGAAESLRDQTVKLSQLVTVFKLGALRPSSAIAGHRIAPALLTSESE
jgi:methyl-accepting chemotaxis protein